MGPLLKPGYSMVLLSYCRSRYMSLCACKWNKQTSLLRQKYSTKMLLDDAVMLFHRKMRHYKKCRALTDTVPLVSNNFLLNSFESLSFDLELLSFYFPEFFQNIEFLSLNYSRYSFYFISMCTFRWVQYTGHFLFLVCRNHDLALIYYYPVEQRFTQKDELH